MFGPNLKPYVATSEPPVLSNGPPHWLLTVLGHLHHNGVKPLAALCILQHPLFLAVRTVRQIPCWRRTSETPVMPFFDATVPSLAATYALGELLSAHVAAGTRRGHHDGVW